MKSKVVIALVLWVVSLILLGVWRLVFPNEAVINIVFAFFSFSLLLLALHFIYTSCKERNMVIYIAMPDILRVLALSCAVFFGIKYLLRDFRAQNLMYNVPVILILVVVCMISFLKYKRK